MEASARFVYEVKDVTKTIYQTRSLLRLVNNVRLSINDIKELLKNPNLATFFWTTIQIFRTISTLRRLLRLLRSTTKISTLLVGLGEIGEGPIGDGPMMPPPFMGFAPMWMEVTASRNYEPIRLEGIDLSMIPEQSMEAVQRVLEEDAGITVEEARSILASWVINWTGELSGSIGWMPDVFGTRIYASAPYAWWVEEGQRSFPGYHYLRQAVDMARMRLPDKIRAELSNVINGEV